MSILKKQDHKMNLSDRETWVDNCEQPLFSIGIRPRTTTVPESPQKWRLQSEDLSEKYSYKTLSPQVEGSMASMEQSYTSDREQSQGEFDKLTISAYNFFSSEQIQDTQEDSEGNQVRKRAGTMTPSARKQDEQKYFPIKGAKLPQISDFRVLKSVGKGKFSEVFLAVEKRLKLVCVLKMIPKKLVREMHCQEQMSRQIKIHTQLCCPSIARAYGFFSDEVNVYIVQEYAGEKSLYQRNKEKKKMSENKIKSIIRQICRGVEYLHERDIMHRDIKLENVILHKDVAKLCDLGCAVQSRLPRETVLGSIPYLCPEQLKEEKYTKKKDIWSLGILTHQLILGYSPYEWDILRCLNKPPSERNLPALFLPEKVRNKPQLAQFLSGMLQPDQFKRFTIGQVLSHPYLAQ